MKRLKFYFVLLFVGFADIVVAQNTTTNCTLKADFSINQLAQCLTSNQYEFTNTSTGGTAPFTYLWDLNDSTLAYTQHVTHTYLASGEHDVTLVVTDAKGCISHASTRQIYIGAKPAASFKVISNTGNGNSFTFISTSTISGGWLNYYWDLGNGTNSTQVNPSATYVPGIYTITLIATGNFGCSDTVTQQIKVNQDNSYCTLPMANFSTNNTVQCLSNNAFVFTNNKVDANTTYDWNFGDGAVSAANTSVTHHYHVAATLLATLTATNACGTSVATKSVTINDVPEQPLAINGTTSIMVGVTSHLTSATPNGTWASANMGIATINPTTGLLTGITAGNTTIKYTVSNACGSAFTTVPVTIAVNNICTAPTANFTVNAAAQCQSSNVFSFTNTSLGTATYNWNFGDGSANVLTTNATHIYTTAGTFTVTLSANNTCGTSTKTMVVIVKAASPSTTTASICAGGTYLFNGIAYTAAGTYTARLTNAIGCDSIATLQLAVKAKTSSTTTISVCVSSLPFIWNGNTYTAIGTYDVHLTNAVGCDSTATLILKAKTATSSITTASICSGSYYTFNGNNYTTAGTYVAHVTNAAGCDSAATLVLTVKASSASTTSRTICASALPYTFNGVTFTYAGTKTAHLNNIAGCDSAATLILTVSNAPEPPAAIVGVSNIIVGTSNTFSSATPNGVWSSSNSSFATVNATIGLVNGIAAGTATINYTYSNLCGSASVNMVVTISEASAPCKMSAGFTINNTTQCVTNNQFAFTSTASGGTAPFTYLWNLNDGSTANTKNVTKTYSTHGEHNITLKVTDSKGCESNATPQHIVVGAKPTASFTILNNATNALSKTFVCASTIATGNLTYMWNFGNGNTSTLVNPTVTFSTGNYTVKLTVTGTGGCTAEALETVKQEYGNSVSIYPSPASSVINVVVKAASTTATTVRIIDLIGRIIKTNTFTPTTVGANYTSTFDARGLMNGAYIVNVVDVKNGLIANSQILKQ